jgi:hypothetical protein
MKRISMMAILVSAAFGAMLAGCATTVEMGPGYYHYDTRAVHRNDYQPYQPPTYYREPTVIYNDHGQ